MSRDSRVRTRSYLALFRLIPWLRPPRPTDEDVETRFYATSSGQNPFEIWFVALAFNLTWILLVCSATWHLVEFPTVLWPLVLLLSGPAVFIVLMAILGFAELLVRVLAVSFRRVDSETVHAMVQQLVLLIACAEASFDSHWIRWVGWAWITLVALELIARVVELAFFRGEAEPSVN